MTTIGQTQAKANGNGSANPAPDVVRSAVDAGLDASRAKVAAFYAKVDERTQGEDVPADEAGTLFVRVFPVKVSDAEDFFQIVFGLIRTVYTEAADSEAGGQISEKSFTDALPRLVPQILTAATSLVEKACVAWERPAAFESDRAGLNAAYADPDNRYGRPELAKLPLHVHAACVAAWFQQSFMGERLHPLFRMVETLLRTTMKKEVKIEELWTRVWSKAAGGLKTFTEPPGPAASSDATDAADRTAGRTPAGPCRNTAGEPVPS